eukprot:TRINITY_DN93297_c0_g1_i2.p1 TRINITY_DN93297_c0_g1~~TRINITY_DN93297_c0_g1_i2.p1  ORF type:complete len:149 (+),score=36.63 TRINITY_DN93297_c0_g1_i2:277-723(+)
MHGALGPLEAVRATSSRCGAAADGLREAAQELEEVTSRLLPANKVEEEASKTKRRLSTRQSVRGDHILKPGVVEPVRGRSIISIVVGHVAAPSKPEEESRQASLAQRLKECAAADTEGELKQASKARAVRPRASVMALNVAAAPTADE